MNERSTHDLDRAPFGVYDGAGERIGYVCTCSCGLGFFQAGGTDAKDRCWELLASHMVLANPQLAALAAKHQARS